MGYHAPLFFKEFLKNPFEVASVVPTSRALADSMVQLGICAVRQHYEVIHVLEVGGGTGAVTERLLERLTADDHLTIIESNPAFFKYLQEKVKALKKLSKTDFPKVRLLQGLYPDILKTTHQQYQLLITSIPFNSFPRPVATKIFNRMITHVTKPGALVFQDYPMLRKVNNLIRKCVPGLATTGLPNLKEKYKSEFQELHIKLMEETVFLNMPPAKAFCLEKIKN
jgi:phosphatidylethanolamine/phosphatidyl-N-methylethanolamine N-methyltransferase